MRQPLMPEMKRRYAVAQEGDAGAQRERWLISFADLMTLLFALFVVLYAAADRERGRAVAEALAGQVSSAGSAGGGSGVLPGGTAVLEAQTAVERVMLVNEALRTRARLMKSSNGFVISLAEAGFFAPGEASVRADARALLGELAETLRETSLQIRVEGHTDATPIATARYPSNWELSACRASAVLAELVARGLAPARLSVAGYASEKPVASNDTAEGRALNRRVDLVILHAP